MGGRHVKRVAWAMHFTQRMSAWSGFFHEVRGGERFLRCHYNKKPQHCPVCELGSCRRGRRGGRMLGDLSFGFVRNGVNAVVSRSECRTHKYS